MQHKIVIEMSQHRFQTNLKALNWAHDSLYEMADKLPDGEEKRLLWVKVRALSHFIKQFKGEI